MRPNTIEEWKYYIGDLAGAALRSQTVAVNSHSFSRLHLDEGGTMEDLEQIVMMFGRQCKATGVQLPEGGPFDLITMLLVDEVPVEELSVEEARFLEVQPPVGTDDFDDFMLEAAFEDPDDQ